MDLLEPTRRGERLVVLLATRCQLRRGEIFGLGRCDIDLDNSTISIEQSRTYRMNGESFIKEPKSKARRRVLAIPTEMTEALSNHLSLYPSPESEAHILWGEMENQSPRTHYKDHGNMRGKPLGGKICDFMICATLD